MINEERVLLMTKMASYEANEGKKNSAIGKFFRRDYISFQVLKSVISATVAFLLAFGLYIFYDFETFMQDIYKMDLLQFGKKVITIYLVVAGAYAVISYVIYLYRYNKAKDGLREYFMNLKKMTHLYDK